MKIKVIIISLFGLIIIGLVGMLGLKAVVADQVKVASIAPIAKSQDVNRERSTIYYFHGNVRCYACTKIEKLAKNVFENNFQDKLNFQSINVDEPHNRHFIEAYSLYGKALILVKNENGTEVGYKNLQEMWDYVRDEQQFNSWLIDNVNSFLLN